MENVLQQSIYTLKDTNVKIEWKSHVARQLGAYLNVTSTFEKLRGLHCH